MGRTVLSRRNYRGERIGLLSKETLVVQDAISVGTVDTDDMPQSRSTLRTPNTRSRLSASVTTTWAPASRSR